MIVRVDKTELLYYRLKGTGTHVSLPNEGSYYYMPFWYRDVGDHLQEIPFDQIPKSVLDHVRGLREEERRPFRVELEKLINKHCKENESDAPDCILAGFLEDCLNSFDRGVNKRESWRSDRDKNEAACGKAPEIPSIDKPTNRNQ